MATNPQHIDTIKAHRSYILDMVGEHPEIGQTLQSISNHLKEKISKYNSNKSTQNT